MYWFIKAWQASCRVTNMGFKRMIAIMFRKYKIILLSLRFKQLNYGIKLE